MVQDRERTRPRMRLDDAVDRLRLELEPARRLELERAVGDLTFDDHDVYKDWVTRAQSHGLIDVDTAFWLHDRLGPVYAGGWPADVDLETKAVATQMIGALAKELTRRV